ncbi:MAG: hypothetical protein AAB225_08460, partial [Acidobacteriota bacterium]
NQHGGMIRPNSDLRTVKFFILLPKGRPQQHDRCLGAHAARWWRRKTPAQARVEEGWSEPGLRVVSW